MKFNDIDRIDFKITGWERLNIEYLEPEEKEELIKGIQNGVYNTSNDVYNAYEGIEYDNASEFNEHISLEENGFDSTVEMYTWRDKLIWSNGIHIPIPLCLSYNLKGISLHPNKDDLRTDSAFVSCFPILKSNS